MSEPGAGLPGLLTAGLEEPLRSLGGTLPIGHLLAEQLSAEVRQAQRTHPEGQIYAPDQFTLSLHPIDVRTLLSSNPSVQDDLARVFQNALARSGYSLGRYPHVTLSSDPTLRIGEIRVIVWHSRDPLSYGPAEPATDEDLGARPIGAFLVVDGKRHFPLDKALITMGRKLDNHLVLADPHVSRRHAEIRLQSGRFVLRDLNSTAGTRVNGQLIHEHSLQPGDVIGIAGLTLIYGEDPGGPPGKTPPYTPPTTPRKEGDQVTPLDLKRLDILPTRPTKDGNWPG
jgi:pSer/pThr/pTyr-binding forkhead associated (FHA) protein